MWKYGFIKRINFNYTWGWQTNGGSEGQKPVSFIYCSLLAADEWRFLALPVSFAGKFSEAANKSSFLIAGLIQRREGPAIKENIIFLFFLPMYKNIFYLKSPPQKKIYGFLYQYKTFFVYTYTFKRPSFWLFRLGCLKVLL